MSRLSASALFRVLACPASAVLPGADRIYDDATKGTVIHAYLEDVATKGVKAALAAVPEEHRGLTEAIDLDQLPETAGGYAAEVQLGYDVHTGVARELGRGTGREYKGLGPTEIPGTIDIVGLTGDAVVVGDYKSGWGGKVVPAWQNPQIRFLSLAAARAWGKRKAFAQLIRIRDDGSVWRDFVRFDAMDLDETAVGVRQVWEVVQRERAAHLAGEPVKVTLGDHCWRCPARARCPGQTQLALAVGSPGLLERELKGLALTPEVAARAWQRVKLVEDLIDLVKMAIKDYAKDNPISLGNGMVLGPRPTEREHLDASVTWQVIADKYGTETANVAVEMKASKAALDRALKTIAARGQLAGLKRDALKEIENRKGITVKTGITVDEHAEEAA